MTPLISIIIPVYNGAQYIKDAVENVFGQTYKNIEIIVVDDGSTDGTKEKIEGYIHTNAVKYMDQPNKGLASARNAGIANAQGEFCKFLDCDDILYPQQIELQVRHLSDKPDPVISITDYDLSFESGNKKTIKIDMGSGAILARFIKSNLGPVHAYLVRRSLLAQAGMFDEGLSSCEDTDLWLRILLQGGIIERLEHTGCCYRIRGGSMSSGLEKHFRQRCKVFEKLNQALSGRLSQMPPDVADELLKSDIKFIHTCFARKINPASIVPEMLRTAAGLYAARAGADRRFVLTAAGIQNILFLKYIKACVKDRAYSAGLLNTTAWRDERNYL
jgi:glycosyltransferase involved in cell wall biosynthesis